ncbi:MAG: two-partner secretion domain-containing protein, partial [Planctomycetota bacterium]
MRNVRKISKKYYVRQIVACLMVYLMLLNPAIVLANIGEGGWDVVEGDAKITGGGSADAFIQMLSDRAVINWDSFDTDAGQLVQFLKETGNFAVLNRIIGEGGPTSFNGKLEALMGDVFIINTRGIVFGPQSYIDARTFVASGIDILNEDFMDGDGVYQFQKNDINPYGNEIGDVTNEGIGVDNGIHAENVALIGKNVTNKGLISAPGGTVILAAGETVLLSESGSDVVVEVAMTDPTDPSLNVVDNGGSLGTGSGGIGWDTDHVILAAGDIWSTAIEGVETLRAEAKGSATFTGYIHVSANDDSDAVADVTIITGDDFTVDNEITAYAHADETDAGNKATANITIDSGGNVNINDRVYASAQVYNGSANAEATINIDADKSVNINSAGPYANTAVEAYAKAKYGSDDALATVNITAKENINIYDGVLAYARTQYEAGDSKALVDIDADGSVNIADSVEAKATVKDLSGDAYADIKIHADGDVDVIGNSEVEALVKSWARTSEDAGNSTATTAIDAGGNVTIGDGSVEAWAVTESYLEDTFGNLTSTVDIDADGDVILGFMYDGIWEGHILAVATSGNMAEGDIGNMSATVDIDADNVVVAYGNIDAVAKAGIDSTLD